MVLKEFERMFRYTRVFLSDDFVSGDHTSHAAQVHCRPWWCGPSSRRWDYPFLAQPNAPS